MTALQYFQLHAHAREEAERAEMERKRREKLLRASANGGSATPTGTGAGGALDAAARLKAKMLGAGTSRLVPPSLFKGRVM